MVGPVGSKEIIGIRDQQAENSPLIPENIKGVAIFLSTGIIERLRFSPYLRDSIRRQSHGS